LTVSAQRARWFGLATPAQATRSGFYAFAHLPGLRQLEFGAGTNEYWSSIPDREKRDMVVMVEDAQGRFLPVAFTAVTPYQKLFGLACLPEDLPLATIPLFSAPARPAPGGLAVVRAELRTAEGPAVHAVLEVLLADRLLGRGLADAQGRTVVFFPYPASAIGEPVPLLQRKWDITLRARYSHKPALKPGGPPDLCAVFAQPVAAPLAPSSATLIYGQELFVSLFVSLPVS